MTTATTLTIRPARHEDTEDVIALRLESEAWLQTAGVQQWTDTARGIRNIQDGIAAGVTYVVADDTGAAIGTLTLNGPDLDWWHDQDHPEIALYLYKLMIGTGWRGTGLGDELLDWACAHAATRGKPLLRLDCWRTNTKLHDYYLQRGFRHVRTEVLPGRGSGALFERPTALRTATTNYLQK